MKQTFRNGFYIKILISFVLVLFLVSCADIRETPAEKKPSTEVTLTSSSTPETIWIDDFEAKDPKEKPLLSPTPITLKAASFLDIKPVSGDIAVFQKFELSIQTDGVYANPYDPADVDLRVTFGAPDGSQFTVPAFWYQDFHQMGNAPTDLPGWRARFSPTQAGEWTVQARLSGSQIKSEPFIFQVAEDDKAKGFVRLHPQNKQYLAIEKSGGLLTFYPTGINMGWGGGEPLSDYNRWLEELSTNKGNIIRIWMASWSFGIEWNDTGLGDYTKRLNRAWQLDQVFNMADENDVYIELVLLNHGAFSASVNPQWDENPYNLKNGGMCESPECFVVDPLAKELFKRRLRYTAARWGYSTHLMAWEWWNEADWTPIEDPEMVAWIREMTPVLQEHDPNHHLISTSYAQSPRPDVNNLPEIDFSQLHLYASTDPILNFPDLYQQWITELPNKPILFAEFGASAGGENQDSIDQQGLHLHNGLWAATFSGFASPAMYWWWDSYVDPLHLWPVYNRLVRFLEGVDLSSFKPGKVRLSNVNVPALSLQTENSSLVFLHDRKYEIGALEQTFRLKQIAGDSIDPDWIYLPDPIVGLELNVRDLKDGEYIARFYLPSEGRWLEKETRFRVEERQGKFSLPDLVGDLAVKITLE